MAWACTLVLVMNIGICDLVMFSYHRDFNTLWFLTSYNITLGIRTHAFVWKCMEIHVLLGSLSANKEAC